MSTGVIYPTAPSGRSYYGTGTLVAYTDIAASGWTVNTGGRSNPYSYAISGANDYVYATASGGYIQTSTQFLLSMPAAGSILYQHFVQARTTSVGQIVNLTVGVQKTSTIGPATERDIATFSILYAASQGVTPTYWVAIEANPFGINLPYAAGTTYTDSDGNTWNFYVRLDTTVGAGRVEIYNVYSYVTTGTLAGPAGNPITDSGTAVDTPSVLIIVGPPTENVHATDTPTAIILQQVSDAGHGTETISKHITRRNAIWTGGRTPRQAGQGDRPRQA